MDKCIASLGNTTIFQLWTQNSGYWHVEIVQQNRCKTAFTSHHRLFRFTLMPFGLNNPSGTFQRTMNVLLTKVKLQSALVYLNDIVIFSQAPDEHFEHIREGLTLLKDESVTPNSKKWEFFTNSIDNSGHIVRPGRLERSTQKNDAMPGLEHPTNLTKLRSFVGLCRGF